MVRRLAFQPPPPQWYGLVGLGEKGGGRCGCSWRVTAAGGRPAGIVCKPDVLLKPTPNPKPRLNAGYKPKAEHKRSILTNLHLKPSLSPGRLEALYLFLNPKPQTQKLKLYPKL